MHHVCQYEQESDTAYSNKFTGTVYFKISNPEILQAVDFSLNTFLFNGISSINFFAVSTWYYIRYWRVFLGGFKPHYSQLWQI